MGRRLISLMAALAIGTVGALAFAAPGNAATTNVAVATATPQEDCLQPQVEQTAGPVLKLDFKRHRVTLPCRQVDFVDNCDGTVTVTAANTGDENAIKVMFRIGDWTSEWLSGGESATTTVAVEDADDIEVRSYYTPTHSWQTFAEWKWQWNASCLEITSVSNCDNTFKVSVKNIGNAAGQFAWQLGIGEPQGTDIPKGATLSQNFNKGDVVNIRWGKDNDLVKTLEFVQPKNCTSAPATTTSPAAPPAAGPNDLPVTGASLGLPIGLAGTLLVGGVVGVFLVLAKRRRVEAADQ